RGRRLPAVLHDRGLRRTALPVRRLRLHGPRRALPRRRRPRLPEALHAGFRLRRPVRLRLRQSGLRVRGVHRAGALPVASRFFSCSAARGRATTRSMRILACALALASVLAPSAARAVGPTIAFTLPATNTTPST